VQAGHGLGSIGKSMLAQTIVHMTCDFVSRCRPITPAGMLQRHHYRPPLPPGQETLARPGEGRDLPRRRESAVRAPGPVIKASETCPAAIGSMVMRSACTALVRSVQRDCLPIRGAHCPSRRRVAAQIRQF
jgi:hypothetical protein